MTATTTMDWYRAKLDEAEKERDELAARVERLTSECNELATRGLQLGLQMTGVCEWVQNLLKYAPEGVDTCPSEIARRAAEGHGPAASLARHDAALRRELADAIEREGFEIVLNVVGWLNYEADRIEQEASGQ